MSTIAITGVDGVLGRRLVSALDARPEVDRIIGVDRWAPRGVSSPKLAFRAADVRDPTLADVFAGADVLIHLAAPRGRGQHADHDAAEEVAATRAVVEAAARAGVGRLVSTSSVLAYGAHPDNDVPLTESSPIRGIDDFELAERARDTEQWLADWTAGHPELDVVVLRLAALFGPGIDSFLTRAFEAPRILAVKGHRPPLQFLHPADATSAILHALDRELTGAYNVAAEGWLSFDEVAAIIGRNVTDVPEELAYSSVERLWALGLGDQPPGIVALFMHPCVMSAERIVATGWQPSHTNRDAVAAMAAEHAPYLTLGTVRAERSTVWRLGGALLALLAASSVWLWRRRGRS